MSQEKVNARKEYKKNRKSVESVMIRRSKVSSRFATYGTTGIFKEITFLK